MIRMIASDLDGTLLLPNHEMPQGAFEAIRAVLDAGIIFVACSGRQYGNLRRLFWPVADRISYVCENGAVTVADGEVVEKLVIPHPEAMAMVQDIQNAGMDLLVSDVNSTYLFGTNRAYADDIVYRLKNSSVIIRCTEELPKEIIKVSGHLFEGIDAVAPKLHERWGKRYSATPGGPLWFDITLGSKAEGLRRLCEHFGIDAQDVAGFGDSFNDEPMLEFVGHPHIMANADERMKKPQYRQITSVPEELIRIAQETKAHAK